MAPSPLRRPSKSRALFLFNHLRFNAIARQDQLGASMTSARALDGDGSSRANDRMARDLHRRVLERVLLKSKTQSVKDSFRLYDRDRAGVLTLDQFRALMRDHDFLEAETELLLRHLDDRGQNCITFHAFLGDIQLGTEQNYLKSNGGNSPKKVQQLTHLGDSPKRNVAKTKAKAKPAAAKPTVEVTDPMEVIRTKLRQRVMGRKSIREVFMEYDVDNSGFLDYDEFGRFMAKYKFTPEETQLIIEFLDKDSSGTVDYDEFAAGLLFYRPPVVVPAAPVHAVGSVAKVSSSPNAQLAANTAARSSVSSLPHNAQAQTTRKFEIPKQIDIQQIREGMRRKLDETMEKAKRDGKTRNVRDEFDHYDVSGNNCLDHQEFGALLVGLGIKLKAGELRSMLQEIDPDDSEKIDFRTCAELLGIQETEGGASGEEQRHVPASVLRVENSALSALFSKYSHDGSGDLNYEEFRRLMNESGVTDDEEIDALIEEMDEVGRGSIRFNEFARVYERRIKPSLKSNKQRQVSTFNPYSGVSSDDESTSVRTMKSTPQTEVDRSARSRLAELQEQELQLMEKILRRHDSIRAAFKEFDQDNRNKMDFEQFRDFMGQYGMTNEASITMLLKRLDVDNSGMIDLQEFLSVFNEQRLVRHKHVPQLVAARGNPPQSDDTDEQKSKSSAQRVTTRRVQDVNPTTKVPATSTLNKGNEAARLRSLEEKWISNALASHSSVSSAFAAVDRDHDGGITRDEFTKLMNEFGIFDEEDIAALMKKLDVDNNDVVEYEKFAAVFDEARIIKKQRVPEDIPRRSSVVKETSPKEAKNARGARLRDLQVKWMKKVLSCHESIETAFYQYDTDGNGDLDHEEFSHFMKRYGIVKNEDIDLLIRRLDTDGSGTISLEEFSVVFNPLRLGLGSTTVDLSAMVAAAPDEIFDDEELASILEIERELAQRMAHQTRDMRLAFRKFDTNGNGLLEYKEFRAVLKSYRLPEMEIRKVIRHLDRDVSGFIDYKEFIAGFGAFKESGGTGGGGGTNSKTSGKRVTGKGLSSKPKPHYRRSPPPKPQKAPSLEMLKKSMLERILSTHGTVQSVFREYDLDKEGILNEAQFVKLVLDCEFSRGEAARLLDAFDQDQSGTVDYQEFLAQLVVKGGS